MIEAIKKQLNEVNELYKLSTPGSETEKKLADAFNSLSDALDYEEEAAKPVSKNMNHHDAWVD